MRQIIAAMALTLVLLPTASAFAQDALVLAFKRCNDAGLIADARIRNCQTIIGAEGIGPLDVAIGWLDLGLAYRQQGGGRDRELDAYNKAIALEPELWQARVDRAQLYLAAGDLDHALTDYQALRLSGPPTSSRWTAQSRTSGIAPRQCGRGNSTSREWTRPDVRMPTI